MAVDVLFHRLAIQEYRAACRWYGRRSPRTEQAFRNAIDRAVQQIAADPEQWPTYRNHYRWVRTRRFPYVLYYHVLDEDHAVILAVAHARRRPGYWLRRSRS